MESGNATITSLADAPKAALVEFAEVLIRYSYFQSIEQLQNFYVAPYTYQSAFDQWTSYDTWPTTEADTNWQAFGEWLKNEFVATVNSSVGA